MKQMNENWNSLYVWMDYKLCGKCWESMRNCEKLNSLTRSFLFLTKSGKIWWKPTDLVKNQSIGCILCIILRLPIKIQIHKIKSCLYPISHPLLLCYPTIMVRKKNPQSFHFLCGVEIKEKPYGLIIWIKKSF